MNNIDWIKNGANLTARFRVTIVAGIHGNDHVLEAVLEDPARPDIDRIVPGRDCVMNSLHPAKVPERVVALAVPAVIGNTDEEVIAARDTVDAWTNHHIGQEGVGYLRSLPFPLGTTLTAIALIAEAAGMLGGTQVALMIYGHNHYISEAVIAGQDVMSIGSVGYPVDGGPRTACPVAARTGELGRETLPRRLRSGAGGAGDRMIGPVVPRLLRPPAPRGELVSTPRSFSGSGPSSLPIFSVPPPPYCDCPPVGFIIGGYDRVHELC